MQEIRFDQKHIIILASAIVTILIVYLYVQFGVLSKDYQERNDLREAIKVEQLTRVKLSKEQKKLEAMSPLVKSEEMKGFSINDKIAAELTKIEKTIDTSNIEINALSMEEEEYFKSAEDSNEAILRKVVTMDIEAATDKDLEKFIKTIQEDKKRVAKIKSVDYSSSESYNTSSIGATIVFYMYYIEQEKEVKIVKSDDNSQEKLPEMKGMPEE